MTTSARHDPHWQPYFEMAGIDGLEKQNLALQDMLRKLVDDIYEMGCISLQMGGSPKALIGDQDSVGPQPSTLSDDELLVIGRRMRRQAWRCAAWCCLAGQQIAEGAAVPLDSPGSNIEASNLSRFLTKLQIGFRDLGLSALNGEGGLSHAPSLIVHGWMQDLIEYAERLQLADALPRGADRTRAPRVVKGRPRSSELAELAGISDDTFRRVRNAATIEVKEKAGAARNRRYSPAEVDRLLLAATTGGFMESKKMAEEWARFGSGKARPTGTAGSKPQCRN